MVPLLFFSFYLVAVVGFEQQRYTFSEASGTGEVCMRVFNPPRNEELVFSILLEYQTILYSAGTSGAIYRKEASLEQLGYS